jgi:hypothetical protein
MRFVELESRGYLIVDLDADKARALAAFAAAHELADAAAATATAAAHSATPPLPPPPPLPFTDVSRALVIIFPDFFSNIYNNLKLGYANISPTVITNNK